MTNPAFTQITFRGRNDDGSESGATWKATQGSDWTQDTGVKFRVRFRIDETASRAWSNKVWNLYYQRNTSGYNAVTGSTPVQFALSDNFVDGDDCTSQLTGGTGTFVTDNNGMKETIGGATNSGTAGYLFETEFCLVIDGAQVADNDTINLRIYDGSSAIAAYTDTPVITVNLTSQNVNETVNISRYNQITVQNQLNEQASNTLIENKGISTLSQVNEQDNSILIKNEGITSFSQTVEQDGSSLEKNEYIFIEQYKEINETLYGA